MAGKKGAPMGNRNAAGTGGARTAVLGSVVPFGSVLGGAVLAASGRNKRALTRHTTVATGLGAIGGGLVGAVSGTIAMPIIGTAIGGVVGSATGAGTSYIGSKVGHLIGRKIR
jgi:hypothetical protein